MKTAREFMQHIADNMDTLTDEDVTALIEADRREVRAAALREALEKVDSCHSIYRRTLNTFDSWASLKTQLRLKIEDAESGE